MLKIKSNPNFLKKKLIARDSYAKEKGILVPKQEIFVAEDLDDNSSPFADLVALSNKTDRAEDYGAVVEGGRALKRVGAAVLDDDVFDIGSVIESIIAEKSLVPKDLKFDDSSIPEAKNFYEWTCDEAFLGETKPFLAQLLLGIVLYAEYCPKCTDLDWLFESHKVSDSFRRFEKKVVLYVNGICPKCNSRRSKNIRKDLQNFYRELAVAAGQRSGKSAVTGGMLATYQTHKVLKMQNPNAVYGLPKNNLLHGTFVALTYQQAKETLWEPYYSALLESPWFQKYHALMKGYEERYGQEILKLKDTFVLYRHRALLAYPAGPDKRTLRGRTRIWAAIDELGWFDNARDQNKVKMNANEVYIALERSLLTVRAASERLIKNGFDNTLTAYFYNVSSPSSVRDKICELVRQSLGSKKILGLNKPTWEMNPNITREDLEEEFRKDPVAAMRDYGAQPPISSNPFISSKSMVENCLKEKGTNLITVRYDTHKLKDGTIERWAQPKQLKPTIYKSVMAIDAGYSSNSFACVVGHLDDSDGSCQIDIAVEVLPLPGIRLNFTLIYEELLRPIIEARHVKVLLADRWNSIKILSDAEIDHELPISRQYSLKYADMWNVKTMMEQKSIAIPRPFGKDTTIDSILNYTHDEYPRCFEHKPIDHLILQMLTVQDTGSQVIKGDGGLTDDLWRALCLAVWGLKNQEFEEHLSGTESVDEKFRPKVIAVSRNLSGGGTGGSNAGGGAGVGGRTIGMTRTRK